MLGFELLRYLVEVISNLLTGIACAFKIPLGVGEMKK